MFVPIRSERTRWCILPLHQHKSPMKPPFWSKSLRFSENISVGFDLVFFIFNVQRRVLCCRLHSFPGRCHNVPLVSKFYIQSNRVCCCLCKPVRRFVWWFCSRERYISKIEVNFRQSDVNSASEKANRTTALFTHGKNKILPNFFYYADYWGIFIDCLDTSWLVAASRNMFTDDCMVMWFPDTLLLRHRTTFETLTLLVIESKMDKICFKLRFKLQNLSIFVVNKETKIFFYSCEPPYLCYPITFPRNPIVVQEI